MFYIIMIEVDVLTHRVGIIVIGCTCRDARGTVRIAHYQTHWGVVGVRYITVS